MITGFVLSTTFIVLVIFFVVFRLDTLYIILYVPNLLVFTFPVILYLFLVPDTLAPNSLYLEYTSIVWSFPFNFICKSGLKNIKIITVRINISNINAIIRIIPSLYI